MFWTKFAVFFVFTGLAVLLFITEPGVPNALSIATLIALRTTIVSRQRDRRQIRSNCCCILFTSQLIGVIATIIDRIAPPYQRYTNTTLTSKPLSNAAFRRISSGCGVWMSWRFSHCRIIGTIHFIRHIFAVILSIANPSLENAFIGVARELPRTARRLGAIGFITFVATVTIT